LLCPSILIDRSSSEIRLSDFLKYRSHVFWTNILISVPRSIFFGRKSCICTLMDLKWTPRLILIPYYERVFLINIYYEDKLDRRVDIRCLTSARINDIKLTLNIKWKTPFVAIFNDTLNNHYSPADDSMTANTKLESIWGKMIQLGSTSGISKLQEIT
jgi:hypothetical protein